MLLFVLFDYVCFCPLTGKSGSSRLPEVKFINQIKSNQIEISCPADINVSTKEDEKINKYCSLAADFHHMYNMPVAIIPVVLGCTGVVSSRCLQFLKKIPGFTLKLFGHLQKAVLIGTSQVLRTIPIHQ